VSVIEVVFVVVVAVVKGASLTVPLRYFYGRRCFTGGVVTAAAAVIVVLVLVVCVEAVAVEVAVVECASLTVRLRYLFVATGAGQEWQQRQQ